MKLILVPDDGREYVLVPKVATDAMRKAMMWSDFVYEAAIAAAPPCKVVELPELRLPSTGLYDDGWNHCAQEIERGAK